MKTHSDSRRKNTHNVIQSLGFNYSYLKNIVTVISHGNKIGCEYNAVYRFQTDLKTIKGIPSRSPLFMQRVWYSYMFS